LRIRIIYHLLIYYSIIGQKVTLYLKLFYTQLNNRLVGKRVISLINKPLQDFIKIKIKLKKEENFWI